MTTTNSYVCGQCGQEFNPPNHVCAPKPVTNANSTINTGLYTHDIKAEIIAARDKWWVEQMESKFFTAIRCRLFPDNCDSCSIIERCPALSWQRFKATLEVK